MKSVWQKAKGAKGDDDEDEFDKLEKEAGTSLAAKLGNSPSLIEKKARKKKSLSILFITLLFR